MDGALRSFVDLRFGMFLHFNMGTFHDAEWVAPGQDPATFDPTRLHCGQWADAAASAGMTFAVLTAKHHDGFCLWPTDRTPYSVASSPGHRDVVRDFTDAFRARGLLPALYFSIWDRQQGVAAGAITPAAVDYVKAQLTELLTGYGPVPLLVIDGWAWQMGHGAVPYGEVREHVRALQPDCLVMDINGVTEPWDTDVVFFEEPKGVWAPPGNTYAACQGENIVPTGWFWHPSTPSAGTMSVEDVAERHLRTLERRYTTFLLNCPPNPDGLLDPSVVARLGEVGEAWRPDPYRPPLPPQPDRLRHPVTPASASATSGDAAAAVDGRNDFVDGAAVQTLWVSDAGLPQSVTLDLGAVHAGLDLLTYLPRQDLDAAGGFVTTGNVTGHRVSVSRDGRSFQTVAEGGWAPDKTLKSARFQARTARYVRLEATATHGGGPAVASEIECGALAARPEVV